MKIKATCPDCGSTSSMIKKYNYLQCGKCSAINPLRGKGQYKHLKSLIKWVD